MTSNNAFITKKCHAHTITSDTDLTIRSTDGIVFDTPNILVNDLHISTHIDNVVFRSTYPNTDTIDHRVEAGPRNIHNIDLMGAYTTNTLYCSVLSSENTLQTTDNGNITENYVCMHTNSNLIIRSKNVYVNNTPLSDYIYNLVNTKTRTTPFVHYEQTPISLHRNKYNIDLFGSYVANTVKCSTVSTNKLYTITPTTSIVEPVLRINSSSGINLLSEHIQFENTNDDTRVDLDTYVKSHLDEKGLHKITIIPQSGVDITFQFDQGAPTFKGFETHYKNIPTFATFGYDIDFFIVPTTHTPPFQEILYTVTSYRVAHNNTPTQTYTLTNLEAGKSYDIYAHVKNNFTNTIVQNIGPIVKNIPTIKHVRIVSIIIKSETQFEISIVPHETYISTWNNSNKYVLFDVEMFDATNSGQMVAINTMEGSGGGYDLSQPLEDPALNDTIPPNERGLIKLIVDVQSVMTYTGTTNRGIKHIEKSSSNQIAAHSFQIISKHVASSTFEMTAPVPKYSLSVTEKTIPSLNAITTFKFEIDPSSLATGTITNPTLFSFTSANFSNTNTAFTIYYRLVKTVSGSSATYLNLSLTTNTNTTAKKYLTSTHLDSTNTLNNVVLENHNLNLELYASGGSAFAKKGIQLTNTEWTIEAKTLFGDYIISNVAVANTINNISAPTSFSKVSATDKRWNLQYVIGPDSGGTGFDLQIYAYSIKSDNGFTKITNATKYIDGSTRITVEYTIDINQTRLFFICSSGPLIYRSPAYDFTPIVQPIYNIASAFIFPATNTTPRFRQTITQTRRSTSLVGSPTLSSINNHDIITNNSIYVSSVSIVSNSLEIAFTDTAYTGNINLTKSYIVFKDSYGYVSNQIDIYNSTTPTYTTVTINSLPSTISTNIASTFSRTIKINCTDSTVGHISPTDWQWQKSVGGTGSWVNMGLVANEIAGVTTNTLSWTKSISALTTDTDDTHYTYHYRCIVNIRNDQKFKVDISSTLYTGTIATFSPLDHVLTSFTVQSNVTFVNARRVNYNFTYTHTSVHDAISTTKTITATDNDFKLIYTKPDSSTKTINRSTVSGIHNYVAESLTYDLLDGGTYEQKRNTSIVWQVHVKLEDHFGFYKYYHIPDLDVTIDSAYKPTIVTANSYTNSFTTNIDRNGTFHPLTPDTSAPVTAAVVLFQLEISKTTDFSSDNRIYDLDLDTVTTTINLNSNTSIIASDLKAGYHTPNDFWSETNRQYSIRLRKRIVSGSSIIESISLDSIRPVIYPDRFTIINYYNLGLVSTQPDTSLYTNKLDINIRPGDTGTSTIRYDIYITNAANLNDVSDPTSPTSTNNWFLFAENIDANTLNTFVTTYKKYYLSHSATNTPAKTYTFNTSTSKFVPVRTVVSGAEEHKNTYFPIIHNRKYWYKIVAKIIDVNITDYQHAQHNAGVTDSVCSFTNNYDNASTATYGQYSPDWNSNTYIKTKYTSTRFLYPPLIFGISPSFVDTGNIKYPVTNSVLIRLSPFETDIIGERSILPPYAVRYYFSISYTHRQTVFAGTSSHYNKSYTKTIEIPLNTCIQWNLRGYANDLYHEIFLDYRYSDYSLQLVKKVVNDLDTSVNDWTSSISEVRSNIMSFSPGTPLEGVFRQILFGARFVGLLSGYYGNFENSEVLIAMEYNLNCHIENLQVFNTSSGNRNFAYLNANVNIKIVEGSSDTKYTFSGNIVANYSRERPYLEAYHNQYDQWRWWGDHDGSHIYTDSRFINITDTTKKDRYNRTDYYALFQSSNNFYVEIRVSNNLYYRIPLNTTYLKNNWPRLRTRVIALLPRWDDDRIASTTWQLFYGYTVGWWEPTPVSISMDLRRTYAINWDPGNGTETLNEHIARFGMTFTQSTYSTRKSRWKTRTWFYDSNARKLINVYKNHNFNTILSTVFYTFHNDQNLNGTKLLGLQMRMNFQSTGNPSPYDHIATNNAYDVFDTNEVNSDDFSYVYKDGSDLATNRTMNISERENFTSAFQNKMPIAIRDWTNKYGRFHNMHNREWISASDWVTTPTTYHSTRYIHAGTKDTRTEVSADGILKATWTPPGHLTHYQLYNYTGNNYWQNQKDVPIIRFVVPPQTFNDYIRSTAIYLDSSDTVPITNKYFNYSKVGGVYTHNQSEANPTAFHYDALKNLATPTAPAEYLLIRDRMT